MYLWISATVLFCTCASVRVYACLCVCLSYVCPIDFSTKSDATVCSAFLSLENLHSPFPMVQWFFIFTYAQYSEMHLRNTQIHSRHVLTMFTKIK